MLLSPLTFSAIASFMEKSCGASAIDHRFRKIKKGAALLKKAVDDDEDPLTVPLSAIEGCEMIIFSASFAYRSCQDISSSVHALSTFVQEDYKVL